MRTRTRIATGPRGGRVCARADTDVLLPAARGSGSHQRAVVRRAGAHDAPRSDSTVSAAYCGVARRTLAC